MNDMAARRRRDNLVRAAFGHSTTNLGQRVAHGAGFTFLGVILKAGITLASMAVLARLLTPADFGYVAMATVVTELAALFASFGLGNLLIQRSHINRLQLDTVFWASTIIGLLLAVAVFLLSFGADWLFRAPLAGELLRVMCLTFVFGGLVCVHEVILFRLLRFRTIFWTQIAVIAVRSLTAISCAYLGFGVWSLVVGSLAASVAAVAFYAVAVPYLPRFRFHAPFLTSSWKVSGSYFGNGLLYYIQTNVDLLLIGRAHGSTVLGYYQNARALTDEVRGRIAVPLQRVLFPAFSALQTDNERLQASVVKAGRLLAATIFPFGIGLSAVAADLVPVLYGPQWLAMIPVLSMLGFSAAIYGSTAIATTLFNAKNRVALSFKYNMVGVALLVTGVTVALPYGIEAIATAVALASTYALLIFRIGLGLIGLTSKHAFQILGCPALAAGAMWLAIGSLRDFSSGWSDQPAALLAIHVPTGALVYVAVLLILSPRYLHDCIELASKFRRIR